MEIVQRCYLEGKNYVLCISTPATIQHIHRKKDVWALSQDARTTRGKKDFPGQNRTHRKPSFTASSIVHSYINITELRWTLPNSLPVVAGRYCNIDFAYNPGDCSSSPSRENSSKDEHRSTYSSKEQFTERHIIKQKYVEMAVHRTTESTYVLRMDIADFGYFS